MLLQHSVGDENVPVQDGQVMRDLLRGFGAQVEWKEYQSDEHWFYVPTGVDDVVDFLNKHLGDKDNGISCT